jgi:hypothetical protein
MAFVTFLVALMVCLTVYNCVKVYCTTREEYIETISKLKQEIQNLKDELRQFYAKKSANKRHPANERG